MPRIQIFQRRIIRLGDRVGVDHMRENAAVMIGRAATMEGARGRVASIPRDAAAAAAAAA
jgi:hypothetical protein